jgi:hypothetical protein
VRPTLAVIHSLGGCGGTLLAKCLGSMPSLVLLSETNPASALLFDGQLNALTQVRDWYPDLFSSLQSPHSPEDLAAEGGFRSFIESLYGAARCAGKTVVLRDYNYVDYFGVPFETVPRRTSSLVAALGGVFALTSAILVRHPLRQYDSLRSHRSAAEVLGPEIFLEGYNAFLRDFESAYVIKYEDVVEEPVGTVSGLCRFLDVPFAEDFLDRFPAYHSVTGNLTRQEDPTISHALWEPDGDDWRTQLLGHPAYHALLERLNYRSDDEGRAPLAATSANTPERIAAKIAAQDREIHRLKVAAARQPTRLEKAAETMIAELQTVSDQRLAVIRDLDRALHELRALFEKREAELMEEAAGLRAHAEARLAALEEVSSALDACELRSDALAQACDERLAVIQSQRVAIHQLRQSDALSEIDARIGILERACEERADLIERLHGELASRDAVRAAADDAATAEATATRARIEGLERACAERADLIERLSLEAEAMRVIATERANELATVSAEAHRRAALIESLTIALEESKGKLG